MYNSRLCDIAWDAEPDARTVWDMCVLHAVLLVWDTLVPQRGD